MWDSYWPSQTVAENWGSTLLHFLWQGGLVFSIHAIGLSLLTRSAAQTRYLWGVACLLLLFLFPLLTFGWLMGQSPVAVAASLIEPSRAPNLTEIADSNVSEPTIPLEHWGSLGLPAVKVWRDWLLYAWGLGVIVLSLRLAAGGWIIYRLRQRVIPLTPSLTQQVQKLRRRLGVSSSIVVGTSARVTTAIACGICRPLVLLPVAWLTQMSPSMLEAVVAHELAHIRRCDLWINLWQRIAETLWFYHPAVWWISASIRRERETCCDDLAVAALQDRVQYAATLEFLAKSRFAGTTPQWLSTGMGGSRMLLLNRVRHVLGMETPQGVLMHWPAMVALALLCVGTATLIRGSQTAVADEQDPQLAAEEYQQAAKNYQQAAEEYQQTAREALEARRRRHDEASELDSPLVNAQDNQDLVGGQDGNQQTSGKSIGKMRRELDQARRQLRETQRVIANLERELTRARVQIERPKRHVVAEAEVDLGLGDQDSAIQPPPQPDREQRQWRQSAAEIEMAEDQRRQLTMEQEMLEHRRHLLESQIEQARAGHQQELELRRQAIELDVKQRMQQQDLRHQLAQLQYQREGLHHQQQIIEMRKRMDEIKVQIEGSEGEDEQRALKHELSQMEAELKTMEAEHEITRKYHNLEAHAEQMEIESSLQSELKKMELEAKMQLKSEVEGLESQLQSLELEKTRLEMQRELLRDRREK